MTAPARPATERARDGGGITSVSGVKLLGDGGSPATGTLLRLAVYRGGGVPATAVDRRRLYVGVVGSTLRVAEMVEGTLKGDSIARMRVRIYATADAAVGGDSDSADQLLYDSRPGKGAQPAADFSGYAVNQQLAIGDREWRVMITPLVDPVDSLDRALIAGALSVMLAIAAMSFWLMSSLATMQLRGSQLAQRNREAALMNSLGEDLHSCLYIAEAYAVLERQMPEILPGTTGALYLFDSSQSRADAAARWGSPHALPEEFAPQECQSIRRGRLYCVDSAAKTLNCGHFRGDPPDCYVCLPLDAQGETIGMLHVQRTPAAGRAAMCSDAELSVMRAAAQHFALALANLRLREKLTERATRDNLTGLYNRHYMQEWLAQELHRAKRHQRSIGVIMLDVDHFKRVNDDFGHAAGDMVLRELAGVLRRVARRSDVPCRHGGEEFLVLMPEVTLEGMLGKAEELRQEVRRLDLAYEGQPLGSITVSAGLAIYPQHAASAEGLLRCADEALYAAKEGGRNRVVMHAAGAASTELAVS
jgi:diguanylate cyclase (GGDEF)-like protein